MDLFQVKKEGCLFNILCLCAAKGMVIKMKDYKTEMWITVIVFTLVVLTGGILSVFFVLGKDVFFGPSPNFKPHTHVLGFPLHYFLLLILSWIGVTVLGGIWSFVMDRIDKKEV